MNWDITAKIVRIDAVTTATCSDNVTVLQVNVTEGVNRAGPTKPVTIVGILVLLTCKSKLFVVKVAIVKHFKHICFKKITHTHH